MFRFHFYCVFAFLTILSIGSRSLAAELLVPADHGSIQAAIDAANNGDTITISDGTWFENLSITNKSLSIRSANGPTACIVDGSTYSAGPEFGNIVRINGIPSGGLSFEGIRFQNGSANEDPQMPRPNIESESFTGAGFHITNSLTGGFFLLNCTITDCEAIYGAGISYINASGEILIDSSTISNCTALQSSGMYAYGFTDLTIFNSVLENNQSVGGGGRMGAAFLSFLNINVESSQFRQNSAESFYGGALGLGGIVTDALSIVTTMNFTDCVFADNVTGGCGGAIIAAQATGIFTRCEFKANHANLGAILCADSGDYIFNSCIMHQNTGNGGFRQSVNGGNLAIDRCTISENDFELTVLEMHDSASSIKNSIIYNNGIPNDQANLEGGMLSYCNGDGNYVGEGVINEDPLFVNPAAGDFRLSEDSPCIDSGDPASSLDPDGTIADMGAIPFDQNASQYIRGDVNRDAQLDVADAVYLIHSLTLADLSFPILCMAAADANHDEVVDLSDVIFIFSYRFLDGEAPNSPFPNCGVDESSPLSCEGLSSC